MEKTITELNKDIIKEQMKGLLNTAKKMYELRREVQPIIFAISKVTSGEVVLVSLPPQVCVLYASGMREQVLTVLEKMIGSLKEDGVEIIGLITVSEAWSAVLTEDNTLVEAEDLIDSRVKVPPSKNPDRKEVLVISASTRDEALRTSMIYSIERDDKGRVTGLRNQKVEDEKFKTIFDKLWKQ